ncbi:MAG: YHS domain-containing protein, partial [Candidatus Aminicenantales bacterium]
MREKMFKDPVCQMKLLATEFALVYRGRRFYFCSLGCLE